MTFDIGIPIPKKSAGRPSSYKELKDFPINGSKFFKLDNSNIIKFMNRVIAACRYTNKDCKFSSRVVIEGGVKGVRVWRVA